MTTLIPSARRTSFLPPVILLYAALFVTVYVMHEERRHFGRLFVETWQLALRHMSRAQCRLPRNSLHQQANRHQHGRGEVHDHVQPHIRDQLLDVLGVPDHAYG
jgi:hypothetical protein